jgi:hypothetical protein
MMMKKSLVTLAFTLLLIGVLVSPVVAQSRTEVGVASNGLNGVEIIGRIDQQLFAGIAYGYVTYISGLPIEVIFSDGTSPLDRGAADARFTFYGTANNAARSVYENIFASNVPLEITYYYSETPIGANFDNPESFIGGTPIATQSIRMQTILNVQEPNVGVLMGYGEGTQSGTAPFTLGGADYTLGHDAMVQDFNLFGQGFRQSEEPLAATYIFGGNSSVVGD